MINTTLQTEVQPAVDAGEPRTDLDVTHVTLEEKKKMLRLKFGFIKESKKLLERLPASMRYVGKPELLSETFFVTWFENIKDNSDKITTLTSRDLRQLLIDDFVLQPGEIRVGLFAIRLKDMT